MTADEVILDSVIDHAVQTIEAEEESIDTVITMQLTFPLLKMETHDQLIFILSEYDAVISAVNNH